MKKLGIYIHIPFCISKCRYCGFYSHGGSTMGEQSQYVEKLIDDIDEYGKTYGDKYIVDTIFFGGGTPTIIEPCHIDDIMTALKKNFTIDDNAEITIESNPKTLTEEKLITYRQAGINRISIGVQSFDAGMLKNLGRKHTAEDAAASFRLARQQGFDNINLDLMFAVPGHSMDLWQETLDRAIALEPEHISFYSLQIEEGTPFFDMFKAGEIEQISDELDREMYHRAVRVLKDAGYDHYEISNCAKTGFQCRHNLKYWSMDDYLGIGSGASSFMGGIRFAEEPSYEYHVNSLEDNMSEFVFTGLRKLRGIDLQEFKERFGKDLWQVYSRQTLGEMDYGELMTFFREGLLIEEERFLRLTEAGIDVSNKIMALFVDVD